MSLVKFIEAGGLLGLQGKELLSWAENELAKEKEQKTRDDERRHERELEIIEKKKQLAETEKCKVPDVPRHKFPIFNEKTVRFLNAKPNC